MEGINYSDNFTLEQIDEFINDKIGLETEDNIANDLSRYYENGIKNVLNGNVEGVTCNVLLPLNKLNEILVKYKLDRKKANIEAGTEGYEYSAIWSKSENIEEGRNLYYLVEYSLNTGNFSFKKIQYGSELFENLIDLSFEKYLNEKNIIGILYGPSWTISYNDIKDTVIFKTVLKPDMLYLKSKINNVEIDIYPYNLKNFKVHEKERLLILDLKDGRNYKIQY